MPATSNGKRKGRRLHLQLRKPACRRPPESWGIVTEGPNPNAARLFVDWFLSEPGQKAMSDNLFNHSARHGASPPPGGEPLEEIKLLIPDDWNKFFASRTEFTKEWDRYTGLR
jgi:iron(III) transport system substrate-binding protein